MNFKKHKLLIPILILCMIFTYYITFNIIQAQPRQTSIQAVSDNHTFGSDYGFTFKYIEGVTSITTGSGYSYLSNSGEYKWKFNGDFPPSNIWARYNNVGLYQGQIVDLKISLIAKDKINGTDQYVSLSKYMEVRFKNVVNPQFKFQFFKHGTNTEMNIKGSMTFNDVDDGQGIQILNGTSNMYYLSSYNWLYQNGDMLLSREWELSESPDKKAWITTTYENSLVMRYLCPDRVDDAPYFGYSANAISGYDTPALYKNISNTNVHNSDEFIYNLTFSMPFISSEYYYNSLQIIDNIPSIFDVSLAKITLTNEIGANVNNKFSTTLINNQLKIQMNNPLGDSSLYGHDYKVSITAKKKSGANVKPYNNSVPNTASITTNKGAKNSNTVNVSFHHNITSSVTNGTITQGQNEISATSNKTFTYAPINTNDYVLSYVKIDGNSIDISQNNQNSYTFNNINNDHTIEVAYRRVYHINTSANTGGTITNSITKIESGTNKTIAYKPNTGYYIESILVDNIPIDVSKNKESYTFNNITTDHSVQVIFKPYMTVEISKEIYDDSLINKLSTLEDFQKYGFNTDNFSFKITMIDTLDNSQITSYVNNKNKLVFNNLKSGHTYKMIEDKKSKFEFNSIKGTNTSFINGSSTNNIITISINKNSDTPQTYKVISKSNLGIVFPSIDKILENLIKL